MSRDWKPGDAAIALHPVKHKAEVHGFIDTDGRFYTTDQSVAGISSSCFALDNLRRLVVIDPEDRQQVERLRDLMDAATFDQTGHQPWSVTALTRGNALQAALREIAEPPPRIEEPTGLGAVVEDGEGERWVRAYHDSTKPWRIHDGSCFPVAWPTIGAVRVLSEGVTE